MTGPLELMTRGQQAFICIGLFVILVVLQYLPRRKSSGQTKRQTKRQQPLDTSQPPSWWEDWE